MFFIAIFYDKDKKFNFQTALYCRGEILYLFMHDMVINRFISEYKNEEKLSSMMEDILTKMGKKAGKLVTVWT